MIGYMTLLLHIPHARSLKDKRQVVKSIVEAVRHKHNVSIAEMDLLDDHQQAVLGVACVSNDNAHACRVLEAVRSQVERNGEALLCDVTVEML